MGAWRRFLVFSDTALAIVVEVVIIVRLASVLLGLVDVAFLVLSLCLRQALLCSALLVAIEQRRDEAIDG